MTCSFVLVKTLGFNDGIYLLSACVPFTVAYLYIALQGLYRKVVITLPLMMERLTPRGLNHLLKVTQ